MRACNFIKKRVLYFPVKLEQILRALFLQNNSGGCFWNYYFFFTLKSTFVLTKLLINQSSAEMNMILTTIPKAQLLSFVTLINWKSLLLLTGLLEMGEEGREARGHRPPFFELEKNVPFSILLSLVTLPCFQRYCVKSCCYNKCKNKTVMNKPENLLNV